MEATKLQRDLVKTAHGQVWLLDAAATLETCREAQERAAADLLEREIWATQVLLEASAAIWNIGGRPPLRFPLSAARNGQCHLEFGRFGHLAALSSPSPSERILCTATSPCWARVAPDRARELSGYTGPLACAYEPIPLADAVAAIGFTTIVSQLELAACSAGRALLDGSQALSERQAHLEGVERMLGWMEEPDPLPIGTRAVRALVGPGHGWLVAAALALLTIPLCLFAGVTYAPLALVPAAFGLLVGLRLQLTTVRPR